MTEYRVELEAYSGPMDLLLYLVRKHEIDLNDVPIAKLTEQYMAHLEQMREMDFELAGEFLVMAATLLEIKSQMLTPRPTAPGSEGEGEGSAENALSSLDPRYELVQQLLAYKRFKDLAGELESRQHEWEHRFAHLPPRAEAGPGGEAEDGEVTSLPIELDLEDASINDLCEAFARILESIGTGPLTHQVVYDDTPISLHAADILDRLQRDAVGAPMALAAIFSGRSRGEAIGLFLALLELVRQRRVRVYQDDAGNIQVELPPEGEPAEAGPQIDPAIKWRDPQTGEVQYDWPDEQSRLRALRRAELRIARLKGEKSDKDLAAQDEAPDDNGSEAGENS